MKRPTDYKPHNQQVTGTDLRQVLHHFNVPASTRSEQRRAALRLSQRQRLVVHTLRLQRGVAFTSQGKFTVFD